MTAAVFGTGLALFVAGWSYVIWSLSRAREDWDREDRDGR